MHAARDTRQSVLNLSAAFGRFQALVEASELRDAIAAHKPGQTVSLTVVHANGTKSTMNVELGRAPATPAS